MLLTRYLAAYDNPLVMLFYSVLLGTFALAPFALWQWVWPATLLQWLLLPALGMLGGTGHYFFIHAYRLAPASIVAPFLYLQLLSMVAFGYAVFSDVPDIWTLAGSAVIIGSGHLSDSPRAGDAYAVCRLSIPSRHPVRRRDGAWSPRPTPQSAASAIAARIAAISSW